MTALIEYLAFNGNDKHELKLNNLLRTINLQIVMDSAYILLF